MAYPVVETLPPTELAVGSAKFWGRVISVGDNPVIERRDEIVKLSGTLGWSYGGVVSMVVYAADCPVDKFKVISDANLDPTLYCYKHRFGVSWYEFPNQVWHWGAWLNFGICLYIPRSQAVIID